MLVEGTMHTVRRQVHSHSTGLPHVPTTYHLRSTCIPTAAPPTHNFLSHTHPHPTSAHTPSRSYSRSQAAPRRKGERAGWENARAALEEKAAQGGKAEQGETAKQEAT